MPRQYSQKRAAQLDMHRAAKGGHVATTRGRDIQQGLAYTLLKPPAFPPAERVWT
jgi:hypothetical protein